MGRSCVAQEAMSRSAHGTESSASSLLRGPEPREETPGMAATGPALPLASPRCPLLTADQGLGSESSGGAQPRSSNTACAGPPCQPEAGS